MFRRTQGFTLLELLIVLVILGITISFTVLSFGLKSPEDDLKEQGLRLAALMQLAAEESILLSQELALQFESEQYYFLSLKNNKWLEIKNDPIFRRRTLPDNMQVELSVEGSDISNEENSIERIYFYSSGEASPFSLTLRIQDAAFSYQLNGDSQAMITHDE